MRVSFILTILLMSATSIFASGNVKIYGDLEYSDGTKQSTATVQGPVGLQGAKGDTGLQGPPGQLTLASICAAIFTGGAELPTFCGPTVSTTALPSVGGTISPISRTVVAGNTTSFTVTPNINYQISSVTGCDGSMSGTTYTTGVISESCTVRANFTFTLSVPNIAMVFVPGGTYTMGNTFGGDVSSNELPAHQVTVDDFYIGKFEVTQDEWQAVMGSNPSYLSACGANCPVERVTWDDVQYYIRMLNMRSGKNYRLPTEAEWEYAARSGGLTEKYSGGNDINVVAWYLTNSGNTTHAFGQKLANGLGLYDMTGNVSEWVNDWYGPYSSAAQINPTGPTTGATRVYRGGCWAQEAFYAKTPYRNNTSPNSSASFLGFRLAAPIQ